MTALTDLLQEVRDRAEGDPESVLPVLELLAHPDRQPTTSPSVHHVAVQLNKARLWAQESAFRDGAVGTVDARRLTRSSRQAVNERIKTGSLLAAKVGSRWLLPGWQFSDGGPVPGLREVTEALRATTGGDVRQADVIMRSPQPDLDGGTLADILAGGDAAEVIRRVRLRTDQS